MTTLEIHDLGPLGDGIHRNGRERIFIERALPGDVVEAKVQKAPGGVFRGDITRIVAPSPDRAAAPCPHYDVCGGCSLQHASEAFYRAWKIETVRGALRRAGLEPARWDAPVFLPAGTRRRATFAAIKKGNSVTLGYFRRRSHQITDVAACMVADPAAMTLRGKLSAALAPILQDGKTADIFIQVLNGQLDVVVTGPVGKKGRPDLDVYEAAARIAESLGLNRLSWRAREHDEPEVLIERAPFVARFGVLSVPLPPLAFLQPTQAGEDALVAAVMEMLPERGTFADLFSGCGTFAGAMLARGNVDAFESLGPAVRALEKARGPAPLNAHRRDLFREPLSAAEAKRYDAIVFDPPRAGAQEQSQALAASDVARLIGVSCNPITFARDARILCDEGYTLDTVKIVDQFTWSHHVELIASFTKR